MTFEQLFFAPLLPWPVLAVMACVAGLVLSFAIWRGLAGWPLRALALLALMLALSGPNVQEEEREALPDILLAVVDDSSSQSLGDRRAARDAAAVWLEQAATQLGLEMRQAHIADATGGKGTRLGPVLNEALSDIPVDQLAGVMVLSDGAIHDDAAVAGQLAALPAPVHLLQNGRRADWDRRLHVLQAPRYAVTGEQIAVRLRVETLGNAPDATSPAELLVSIGGAEPERHLVRVGQDLELQLVLSHAGETVVHLSLVPLAGELTDRNNQAALRINGIRDRLRVLLVSGEPHPGTRTWRNLLKSDASVDLVHFTILRPPEKQDGVPVNELSLIPFPTQQLFIDKIDEFDLIIFDRYRLRGILPGAYLDSVRAYVERGGAVLVAAGPEFASVESLSRSALGEVLPVRPKGRVIEAPMRPELTETGVRHPVTQGLSHSGTDADNLTASVPGWGSWLRHLDLEVVRGQVVMQTPEGGALITLDRVAGGRVALIGSDQVWLWGRGYEGGGPQLELLRRLAHWMTGEPELEEEALVATETSGGDVEITRQTLADTPEPLMVEPPDGGQRELPMVQMAPGRFVARLSDLPAQEASLPQGVYRFTQGDQAVVAVRGAAAPREFANPLARPDPMRGLIAPTGGSVWALEDGFPRLRAVQAGRAASGRGWIGYTPRSAFVSRDLRVRAVLPRWAWLLLASGAVLFAWLREGRRYEPLQP